MTKITLANLVNLQNETTAVSAINANNAVLSTALDNTLSRDGTSPNRMGANLDMNSNRILNCISPSSPSEPVTLAYFNTITPGVISGVSTVSTYASRSLAAAATIPGTTVVVQTGGYASSGDGGGGIYHQVNSLLLGGFQSADGHYWAPDFSSGINIRMLGAGLGNGVNDVAAMTTALNAANQYGYGYTVLLTAGSTFDFSTGNFFINKTGTRILGDNMRSSVISFNPSSPATLFTFHDGTANGISNCEISNLTIISSNSVQKYIICPQNTAGFLMDSVDMQSISSGGSSIGLFYQGRNFLTVRNCFINADIPVYLYFNPDRALAGFEDGDFITFLNNQLTCLSPNSACYTVLNGISITNWTDTGSDWALGRYGILNIDTTATQTSYSWRFENIRREQEEGAGPTMFAILRSSALLRDLQIINCACGLGGLFNLTGIDRVDIQDTTVFPDNISIGTVDSTVSPFRWTNLFAQTGNTISIGNNLNLVKGSEKIGGTNAAPIYRDALYSNTPDSQIEWIGPPSTNGRRTGIYRLTTDVPVYTGANAVSLYPWTVYTVQYATIRVSSSSPTSTGIVNFISGQVAPAGNTILVGGTTFAIDASASKLSAFHFSDINVGLVNKLASSVPVTVEVIFTI